jgi:hypothetical protein
MKQRLLHGTTPGERAFDRCLCWFPFALWLSLVASFYSWLSWRFIRRAHMPEELPSLAPDSFADIWLPIILGLLLLAYWVWAIRAVVESWSDPVARVLRFCSLILLMGQSVAILSLLGSPLLHLLNSPGSR